MKVILIIALAYGMNVFSQTQSGQDMYQQFQQMKEKMINELFADDAGDSKAPNPFGDSFFKDFNSHLFEKIGNFALENNLFTSEWVDVKNGRELKMLPKDKSVTLEFEIDQDLINIKANKKTENTQQSSQYTMSVPQDLDGKSHKISEQGKYIVIFFPLAKNAGSLQAPGKMILVPDKEEEKTTPLFKPSKEDDVI